MTKTTSSKQKGRVPMPDPEVVAQARRRQFAAAYKRQIVAQADACTAPGEIGALLRREGLYSSHLTNWRRQVAAGTVGISGAGVRRSRWPPRMRNYGRKMHGCGGSWRKRS